MNGDSIMSDINDGFYVMTFHSVNHGIQTETKAKELFELTMIPTPRELANDCGIAIRLGNCEYTTLEAFYMTLTVPANVYFLSNKKFNCKRKVVKLL